MEQPQDGPSEEPAEDGQPQEAEQGTSSVRSTPRPAAIPFDRRELLDLVAYPARTASVVLAEPERMVATIDGRRHSFLLVSGLLVSSVLFTLPFGAVVDLSGAWRIAVLYVGSLLLCVPSLHVFSAYVGARTDFVQNLALGLWITAVVAMFTFGLFPILWFLDRTSGESTRVTPQHLLITALSIAFLAGLGHGLRALLHLSRPPFAKVLLFAWFLLLTYITGRMAQVLELV